MVGAEDSSKELTLEQSLRYRCRINIAIIYYTDQNIREVVRNRFRTFLQNKSHYQIISKLFHNKNTT